MGIALLARPLVLEALRAGRLVELLPHELKPMAYYIYVEKGQQRNDGAGVLTAELEEGKVNKVNVVIY